MSQVRLFHTVAQQILQLIADEGFGPGAKLPGERELAERFGVSRVTVREAEVALQAQGRLAIKTGSGVFVRVKPAGDELPIVSAFEVTEARSLFESEAAALAASVIKADALERLDYLVRAMDGSNPDLDPDAADREFHQVIAASANNTAILHTIETLWRMRTEQPQVRAVHAAVCEREDDSSRVAEHAAILDALKAHDPGGARRAMRSHFNRLLSAMLDASAQTALQELERQVAASRERFLISTRSD